jgi:hypothetical protein
MQTGIINPLKEVSGTDITSCTGATKIMRDDGMTKLEFEK